MGYIAHHAIVVTGYGKQALEARAQAVTLFAERADEPWQTDAAQIVSPPINSWTNGYISFFIAPDGSKEGWETSAEGDRLRAEFIGWLRSQEWPPDWALVRFGGDDDDHCIVEDHGGIDTDPGPFGNGHAETPPEADENGSDRGAS